MKSHTRSGTETRRKMIAVAADLFHKQGVVATSPEEIIKASATGKGQFYHYFKSKEGLIHAVLQTHLNAIKNGTAPVEYTVSTWADLERWFLTHLELQKHYRMTRGCPFGTVGNEVTPKDELIRQDLNLIFEIVKAKLVTFFVREKAQGRLCKDAIEDQMAEFCIAAIQGAMLMGKIKQNSRPVETTIREAMLHLKRYAVAPKH